ncbi:hypothetical protein [Bradyrhizobium sp. USDA 4353]
MLGAVPSVTCFSVTCFHVIWVDVTSVYVTSVYVTSLDVMSVDAPVSSGRRALDNAVTADAQAGIFDNPGGSAKRKAMENFTRRLEQL